MRMEKTDGFSEILERTRQFVAALKAVPAVQRFKVAEQRFRTDPELQRIMEELRQKMETFREAQAAGTLRAEQVQQVREAQGRLQQHPLVQEFSAARETAGLFLQETNRVISEILGLDFGQLIRAGGAC